MRDEHSFSFVGSAAATPAKKWRKGDNDDERNGNVSFALDSSSALPPGSVLNPNKAVLAVDAAGKVGAVAILYILDDMRQTAEGS